MKAEKWNHAEHNLNAAHLRLQRHQVFIGVPNDRHSGNSGCNPVFPTLVVANCGVAALVGR